MIRTRRFLAAVGAVLALAVGVAACGSSPYAATVNNQSISQDSLNNEISALSANKIADSEDARAGVKVAGVSSGTYSSAWVAAVLQQLVLDRLIHKDLANRHDLPTAADQPAAWAAASLTYGAAWSGYSNGFQAVLAERLAELTRLAPVAIPAATLLSVYKRFSIIFWSNVCFRQIAVSVHSSDGALDRSGSRSRAASLSARLNSGQRLPGISAGVTCVTPTQLESYPAFERSLVRTLRPGAASQPYAASYGYYVIEVTSRDRLKFSDPSTQRTLSYLTTLIVSSQRNTSPPVDTAIVRLARAAKVAVNPAYGAWHTGGVRGVLGLRPPAAPSF